MNFLITDELNPNHRFLRTTNQRISDFLKLPRGWHYGEGHAPNEETIDDALRIYNQATLLGLKSEAFPGVDGEIQINCYSGNKTLEFTVESTGIVSLTKEENDIETSSHENLSVEAVLNIVREEYGETTWNSFDQSIQSIIASTESDLRAGPSRIPLTGVEYRSYLAAA
ncbi:hypothetical protein HQ584_08910 [Patescibacteria group bacterium]|nr:hypothetical protein [Patescibacteria group bacterium]